MAQSMRSRKAILVSLLLHIVVLTGVGGIAGKAFVVPETPEQYLELELANDIDTQLKNDPMNSGSAIPDASKAAVSRPAANNQVVASAAAPSAEVSTGDLVLLPIGGGGNGNGASSSSVEQNGGGGTSAVPTAGSGQGDRPSGGTIAPRVLSFNPVYPEDARKAGHEGTVLLKIKILTSGRAGNIIVYQTSGFGELDNAAIEAARRGIFVPAKDRDSGQAIACDVKKEVVFRLKS